MSITSIIQELNDFKKEKRELEEQVRELKEKDQRFNAMVGAIQDILNSEPIVACERFEKLLELLKRDNLVFQEVWQITSECDLFAAFILKTACYILRWFLFSEFGIQSI